MRLVDQHMSQTVHRLETVALTVYLGEVHILAVVLVMTGGLPQVGL